MWIHFYFKANEFEIIHIHKGWINVMLGKIIWKLNRLQLTHTLPFHGITAYIHIYVYTIFWPRQINDTRPHIIEFRSTLDPRSIRPNYNLHIIIHLNQRCVYIHAKCKPRSIASASASYPDQIRIFVESSFRCLPFPKSHRPTHQPLTKWGAIFSLRWLTYRFGATKRMSICVNTSWFGNTGLSMYALVFMCLRETRIMLWFMRKPCCKRCLCVRAFDDGDAAWKWGGQNVVAIISYRNAAVLSGLNDRVVSEVKL